MRTSGFHYLSVQLLAAASLTAAINIASPFVASIPPPVNAAAAAAADFDTVAAAAARQQQQQHQNQKALQHQNLPAMPPTSQEKAAGDDNYTPRVQTSVMLSDVMGKDRSINLFAGFARDILSITQRLDSASQNSTVLAPLNSAVDSLPRKPWEDSRDYDGPLGANVYEGDEGRDRAERNMRRFVEAHVLPLSPWREGEKVKSLLAGGEGGAGDGDREVWWEMKGDKRVIFPDEIEVSSVASSVGNGEVWIIKGVRNYA